MSLELQSTAPETIWHSTPARRHFVQFYETDEFLLDTLAQYVATTLTQNEASIVVATGEHLTRLNDKLGELGIDIPTATQSGQYVDLDANEVMSRFMDDGMPDPVRFRHVFGAVIGKARAAWPVVRVYGEMVALTAKNDERLATIGLEELWNELQSALDFSLCCAYPVEIFSKSDSDTLLLDICSQHAEVLPAESYTRLPSTREQLQAVALLQQKANRLELEAAQRKRVEEQLRDALEAERAARKEAEAALRMRDEFVSVAAHELKTPLTSLLGHLQLTLRSLQNGHKPSIERVTASLESVNSQANKLSRLVSQLLDISRIEGGQLPIEPQPVDLAVLAREAVDAVHTRGDRHRVVISTPDSLITEVDPLRIEQVIANLLNNAVRYSPAGGTIAVSLTVPEKGMLELSIRDHGLGIPPDKREQIFERYYQAHSNESRSGMGLGLYISRQIVELHGGQVHAEFPPDGGTCFIVRLPVPAVPGNTQPNQSRTDTELQPPCC